MRKGGYRYIPLLIAILLLFTPELLFRLDFFNVSVNDASKKLEHHVTNRIDKSKKTSLTILSDTSTIENIRSDDPAYFLFYKDRLTKWSTNKVNCPSRELINEAVKNPTVFTDGNGTHLVSTYKSKNIKVVSLIALRLHYKFSNSYLTTSFQNGLELSDQYDISTGREEHSSPVKYNGEILFYVVDTKPNESVYANDGFFAFFQGLGLLVLLFSLTRYLVIYSHRRPYVSTIVMVFLFSGLKLLLSFYSPLHLLRKQQIFNPEIFASSALDPSLGDFLISFVLFFFGCLLLYRNYYLYLQGNKKRFIFYLVFTNLLLVTGIYMLLDGLESLVMNSQIDFFFKNIRSLNEYTILGIFALGTGLYGILFLISKLRHFYLQYGPAVNFILAIHTGGFLFFYFIFHHDLIWQQTTLSILSLIYICWPEKNSLSPFNSTSIVLIVFSIIAATVFYNSTIDKERSDRLLLAEKISDSQDPDMEVTVSNAIQEITCDSILADYVTGNKTMNTDSIENYIDRRYFQKTLKDYEINYYLLLNDSVPIYPFNTSIKLINDHRRIIALSGKLTGSRYLYFIYNKLNGIDYLASLPLVMTPFGSKIDIEFINKKIPQRAGFEELLTNKNSFYAHLLADYSYVIYVNNNLIDQRGNFLYKKTGKHYNKYKGKFQFYNEDGFEHLLYRLSDETFVIVSRPFTGWLTHITSFSYILILFAIEFLIISYFLFRKKVKGGFYSLSSKIQFAFIMLTIIAMTLFGLTTQYTISKQYTVKNKALVAEKLESIQKELLQEAERESIGKIEFSKYLPPILSKIASVHKNEINFYSSDGALLSSSVPELFRYGIAGRNMNPTALLELKYKGTPRFIQDESIGGMNYVSGYLPIYNNENELLGYMNIPYFPRQNEVTNEFSSLLMAIINIFVVLFAFTILISVIVTQIILSPVTKIKESIAKIQLNKVNKPIVYKGKDELAELVKEYNNKVADLEKFAFYLAQNERESAWREMAKQVAHEIKNPLTPMKLNIQHMQRSLRKDDPDFNEKLERISKSMIEQIDALTTIAEEFSSIAKMPGMKFEKLFYNELINNVIELFNEDEHIKFEMNLLHDALYVNGDKEQLLRVLNNLLKNAMQSIPEEREGKIIINVIAKSGKIITSIEDNGTGINEHQRLKIFTPNFTTKSTGSGLGLVMVKNIIEQHSGNIRFESDKDKGTRFIFELPMYND